MTDEPPLKLTEAMISAKWNEIAPLIDRLNERTDDADDFPVLPRSPLAQDNQWSDPYQVSHAVMAGIVSGTDHLHALKTLVFDAQKLHWAAPASLVRGALENMASSFWILHPSSRSERLTRTLRWYWKNAADQHKALGPLDLPGYKPQEQRLAKILAVAERCTGVDPTAVRQGYFSTEVVTYADKHAEPGGLGVLFPWQLCSGFAHGRPWAPLAFSEREEHPTDNPDVTAIRFSSDMTRVLYLVWAAMNLTEAVLKIYQERSRPPY